jgi:hypothetical protein
LPGSAVRSLSPFFTYHMHTSQLPKVRWADSVGRLLIRGSDRWRLNLAWGGLATAAWKKGGRLARCPG